MLKCSNDAKERRSVTTGMSSLSGATGGVEGSPSTDECDDDDPTTAREKPAVDDSHPSSAAPASEAMDGKASKDRTEGSDEDGKPKADTSTEVEESKTDVENGEAPPPGGIGNLDADEEPFLDAAEHAADEWGPSQDDSNLAQDFSQPAVEAGTDLHTRIMASPERPNARSLPESPKSPAPASAEDPELADLDRQIDSAEKLLDAAITDAITTPPPTPVDTLAPRTERRSERLKASLPSVTPGPAGSGGQEPSTTARPPGPSHVGGSAASG